MTNAKRKEQEQLERDKRNWRAVLETPAGRYVLMQILQAGDYRADPFVPGDQAATAHQCGKLSVANAVLAHIYRAKRDALFKCEDEYVSALKGRENKNQQEQEDELI